MSIQASIDLGTNTCLLLIADCLASESETGQQIQKVLSDHSRIVRLGQGVDQSRMLRSDAIERTVVALREYALAVKAVGIEPAEVLAVATSQARDAKNGAEFFLQVEKETGFRFQTITGQAEAEASFAGALLPTQNPNRSAVIDIGGGSTEFMASLDGRLVGESLDVGSVRFTERFFNTDPVTDEEFWACQAEIDELFLSLQTWRKSLSPQTELVGVAGTVTTLASWHLALPAFRADLLDGVELTRGDIHRMVEELKWRTAEERRSLVGIEPLRADVLLAGSMILWRAMEVLDFKRVFVSTRGLRYGVLLKRSARNSFAS